MCGVLPTGEDVLFDCGAQVITNVTGVSYGALSFNSDGLFDRQCADGPTGPSCSKQGLRDVFVAACVGKRNCRMPVTEAAMGKPGTGCAAAKAAGSLKLWASVVCGKGCIQNVNCDVQSVQPAMSVNCDGPAGCVGVLSKVFAKAKDLDPFTVMKRVTSVFALLFMYLLQGRARNVKWTSRHLVYRTSTWHKTKRRVDCGPLLGEHKVGLPRDCQWCPCSNNFMETIDAVHIRNVTMIQDPFQYRCGVGDVIVHVHARGRRHGSGNGRRNGGAPADTDCLSRCGCKHAKLETDTLVIEDVSNVHDFYDFLNYKLEEDAGAGFISNYQPEVAIDEQPQSVPGGSVASSMHAH